MERVELIGTPVPGWEPPRWSFHCDACGLTLPPIPRASGFHYCPGTKPIATTGPGSILKGMLGRLGIKANECQCESRAREMDARGPDWCEQNIDTIVGWLREGAEKKKLPFVDWLARKLVLRAIKVCRSQA